MLRNFLISFSLLFALTSCGGGSSDGSSSVVWRTDASGSWLVSFISITDGCELLPGGSNAFEDDQIVTVSGNDVEVTSAELPLGDYLGMFRAEDSFTAYADQSGDLFGQGFNCTLSEGIGYNELTDSSANVVYEVKIICDDGTRCDTVVRGSAERISS